jgi:hypothetical protein
MLLPLLVVDLQFRPINITIALGRIAAESGIENIIGFKVPIGIFEIESGRSLVQQR